MSAQVSWQAGLANRLWQLLSYFQYQKFRRESHSLQVVQERLLTQNLQRLHGTIAGQRWQVHNIDCYRTFREQVPLQDYQSLQPLLALSNGVTKEIVRVWEPTGGSSGGTKWIPWTASVQAQFRRAVSVWIFDLFRRHPELRNGRSYWQLTPQADVTAPDWLKHAKMGFESDGDYLGSVGRLLERMALVKVDKSGPDFWEQTVRALLATPDLRLISCWSPSFLLVLKQKLEDYWGAWQPELWWPNLGLVSCWTQGPSKALEDSVQVLFPQAKIQGKGLLSTEAITSLPFSDSYPLAYQSHFFEFLGKDGLVVPSWQVELGKEYEVVQTVGNGLTRYRSGDLVMVTGFFHRVPCLEFLDRRRTSDLFGEKLEYTFLSGITNGWGRFAKLSVEENAYVLFLDEDGGLEEVDACYRQLNESLEGAFSYKDCRGLGQLSELRCFLVHGSGWKQMSEFDDLSFAKQKPGPMLPEGVWSQKFRGHFIV